ncbi:unnamed protein product, partial [marine sediment metagenome]
YCDDYYKMPSNVVLETDVIKIKKKDFMPSYLLAFEGKVTGAGIMVATGYLPIERMWCPNTGEAEVELVENLKFTVKKAEKFNLYTDTVLTSYIKAGQNMEVLLPSGKNFNMGIDLRFSHNPNKPVFTELSSNHTNGVNALFGDHHIEFYKCQMGEDWIEGDPRLFKNIVEMRGIGLDNMPETPRVIPDLPDVAKPPVVPGGPG